MKIEKGLGNSILRKKSQEVQSLDKGLLKFIESMKKAMVENNGIGLAAPQVGRNERFFIMYFDQKNSAGFESETRKETNIKDPKIIACINPKITQKSEEICVFEEGCLSLPDEFSEVERPSEIMLEFLDEKGRQMKVWLRGINARVAQHEYDHLDGVLFLDKALEKSLAGKLI